MFLQLLYRQVLLRPPSQSSSEMPVERSQSTRSKCQLLCGVGGVPDLSTLLHVTTETTESVSETRIKDSVSWYGWRPETANDDEAPIQFSKGKSTRGSQEQRAAFGMSKTSQRQSCQRRPVEERLFSPLLSQYCQAEDLDFCEQEEDTRKHLRTKIEQWSFLPMQKPRSRKKSSRRACGLKSQVPRSSVMFVE